MTDVQVDCALAVGDAFGGGVVYRIDGGTAYILSLADVATSVTWGPLTSVTTSANNTFDASDNTYNALAGSNFPAAAACRTYDTGDGAGNWYLPAQNEWPLVVANIGAINAKSSTTVFIQFTVASEYWSSTQDGVIYAVTRFFSTASSSLDLPGLKTGPLRVRCVRALTI